MGAAARAWGWTVAARGATRHGAMFAPPPLLRTLAACFRDMESPREAVRASAASDLARNLEKSDAERARGISSLVKALGDPAPSVRAAAATALADVRAGEALPSLVVAVEDPDALVRQMALSALGEIGDPRVAQRLRRALKDERPEVRYQAVIAFGRVCPEDAEIGLVAALNDDDPAVRHIALRLAEERVDLGLLPLEASPLRGLAASLLEDSHGDVAVAAAVFLAKLGDPRARPVVLRVVRGQRVGDADINEEDEQAAVEVSGALGLREAIPDLERRAFGLLRLVRDTCSFHAKIALATLGHPRAVDEILRDLGSPKDQVQAAAVVAAGRARVAEARPLLEKLAARQGSTLVQEALARLGST